MKPSLNCHKRLVIFIRVLFATLTGRNENFDNLVGLFCFLRSGVCVLPGWTVRVVFFGYLLHYKVYTEW